MAKKTASGKGKLIVKHERAVTHDATRGFNGYDKTQSPKPISGEKFRKSANWVLTEHRRAIDWLADK